MLPLTDTDNINLGVLFLYISLISNILALLSLVYSSSWVLYGKPEGQVRKYMYIHIYIYVSSPALHLALEWGLWLWSSLYEAYLYYPTILTPLHSPYVNMTLDECTVDQTQKCSDMLICCQILISSRLNKASYPKPFSLWDAWTLTLVFKRGMISGILTHWARPLLSLKCGCGRVSGLWTASINNTSFRKTLTLHMQTQSTEGLTLLIWAFMLYTDVWNCGFSYHHQGEPNLVIKLAQTFFFFIFNKDEVGGKWQRIYDC